MRKLKILLLILSLGIIAGCGPIKPYEVDVQQGNLLDQKDIKQLHVGMSKSQVASLLGMPVLGDAFEDDHWSYVYTNQINGGKIEKRNLELDFSDGRLSNINSKN